MASATMRIINEAYEKAPSFFWGKSGKWVLGGLIIDLAGEGGVHGEGYEYLVPAFWGYSEEALGYGVEFRLNPQ
jgi:hypothetical protein